MIHDFTGKNIGIALTGSYCTYEKVFVAFEELTHTGANLFSIFSDRASTTDSRFGKCQDFWKKRNT